MQERSSYMGAPERKLVGLGNMRENRMTGNSCMSNDKKQFYKLNYGLLVTEMN